ncbi:MAG: hypothetical protein WAL98_16395 [Desulfatiglandaceae bacterium]
MLDQQLAGLAGLFGAYLFRRPETKRPGGTSPDTRRCHAVIDAHVAQITFDHLPIGTEVGRAKRTGQYTAMTSNADITIQMDDTIVFIPKQRARRANHDAGGVAAVKTGQGKEGYQGMLIVALFARHYSSESDIGIVLVLAGNYTGIAAGAARRVK